MASCVKHISPRAIRQWSGARVEYAPSNARCLFSTTTSRLAKPTANNPSNTSHTASSKGRDDNQTLLDADYETTDISSLAHAELQHHRELRRMLRTAAWEMPLLSEHASKYERPDKKLKPLRWRYTTYMGELHPAGQKVVVEFEVNNLPGLEDWNREKLRKLAGPRYNPDNDVIKMSCDSHETQAQNRKHLLDLIKSLVRHSKHGADKFEDIPLDTRHAKPKVHLNFPVEWRLTAERKQELDAKRETQLLEEKKRIERLQIVDGQAVIEAHLQTKIEDGLAIPVEARRLPSRR